MQNLPVALASLALWSVFFLPPWECNHILRDPPTPFKHLVLSGRNPNTWNDLLFESKANIPGDQKNSLPLLGVLEETLARWGENIYFFLGAEAFPQKSVSETVEVRCDKHHSKLWQFLNY